jgi:hypothetical protein
MIRLPHCPVRPMSGPQPKGDSPSFLCFKDVNTEATGTAERLRELCELCVEIYETETTKNIASAVATDRARFNPTGFAAQHRG